MTVIVSGSPVATARSGTARRGALVIGALAALVVAVAGVALAVGAYTVSPADLVATLLGQGSGRGEFVVMQLRLPRVVMGLIAGLAFALSGALFQSLLGNPLASPDIIGITGGASAAAVGASLLLGASGLMVSAAAFGGGMLVAALISLLSWRSGLTGNRFVLVGIACAFLVEGALGYLLTRADVRDAQSALVWLVGSLSGVRWPEILVAGLALVALLPVVVLLAPRLRILQLGDQSAAGLGLPVQAARGAVLATAVALAAVGTAAVGPIAFVAFVSAPIARRLARSGGLDLVPSALIGALLVLSADFVAQHLLPDGITVPVGIITGAVGAPYLLWLLATSNRRGETR